MLRREARGGLPTSTNNEVNTSIRRQAVAVAAFFGGQQREFQEHDDCRRYRRKKKHLPGVPLSRIRNFRQRWTRGLGWLMWLGCPGAGESSRNECYVAYPVAVCVFVCEPTFVCL